MFRLGRCCHAWILCIVSHLLAHRQVRWRHFLGIRVLRVRLQVQHAWATEWLLAQRWRVLRPVCTDWWPTSGWAVCTGPGMASCTDAWPNLNWALCMDDGIGLPLCAKSLWVSGCSSSMKTSKSTSSMALWLSPNGGFSTLLFLFLDSWKGKTSL